MTERINLQITAEENKYFQVACQGVSNLAEKAVGREKVR
jgi:hypothetical protein